MNLSSKRSFNTFVPASASGSEFSLVMTPEEYASVLKGKVLVHATAAATMSGQWEVRFKKNSAKRHKTLYGVYASTKCD